jgi:hypothetical protein
MLRDAGDLVFSGRTSAQTDRFRRELALGLGPHAENLERLRDRLVVRLVQECDDDRTDGADRRGQAPGA